MVILMASKGRPTRESLLAVGKRTLVGSFARMNPSVSGERARVTKRLDNRKELVKMNLAIHCGLYLRAVFAHVRFFASVDSSMHCQCRPLDELLVTARVITDVRSHPGMYTLYDASSQPRWFELCGGSYSYRA